MVRKDAVFASVPDEKRASLLGGCFDKVILGDISDTEPFSSFADARSMRTMLGTGDKMMRIFLESHRQTF